MPKAFFKKTFKRTFIFFNIVIAALYVIGCYGKIFFSTSLWQVGFACLSAFYLLLTLLIFIAFWLFVKAKWALISIIAIVITIVPLQHIIPFRFNSNFDKLGNAADLRVMSWNVAQFDILYNKRQPDVRDNMLALINEYKPDIACFQEMVAADTLYNLNSPYYKKYSFFSIFEYAEKLNFPYYHFLYHPSEDFLDHEHFGLVIFSRYPIVNKQSIFFVPNDYNSNFEYIDIVKDGDTIRVFNIHLQSIKLSPGNLAYIDDPTLETKKDLQRGKSVIDKIKNGFIKRKTQADRIHNEILKSPYPVIVCGDLNDVPNSYAYSTIGTDLQNAFSKKGSGLGRSYINVAPTLRIDNIFCSKTFSVNQFLTVPAKLSDHYPIIADLGKKK